MQNTYYEYQAWQNEMLHNSAHLYGQKFFVDTNNGSDTKNGKTYMQAKATITAAINAARYKADGVTINDDKDHCAYIFIAPGHYNEAIAFAGYNIHLIGMGCPVPGKDYGVSINYNGAIDTTAVLAIQGSGNSFQNLHVYVAEAIPGILIDNGDNHFLKNIVVECDGTNATYGVHAKSLKGSKIEGLTIINPTTAGIFANGGADKYTINGHIKDCKIIGSATGVKGIHIDSGMTAYNFEVANNSIDVESGGATSIGIHNESGGNVNIHSNAIIKHASASDVTTNGSSSIEGDVEGKIDSLIADIGDVTARTNLKTLLTLLGNPDEAGASLWAALTGYGAIYNSRFGKRVTRAKDAVMDGNQNELFTVSGGRVLITHLEGEICDNDLDAAESADTKFMFDPDVGTDSDLCAVGALDAAVVGTLFGITGTPSDALLFGVGTIPGMTAPVVVAEGSIDIKAEGSVGDSGATASAELYYIPLDAGATVEAVAIV